MTLALLALAAVLVAFLAWRLAKVRSDSVNTVTAPLSLGALGVDVPLADQVCASLPWAAQLSAPPVAGKGVQTATTLGAGDWYDPTTTSYSQTFNEYGFITSPSPAPVDPKTGRVPLTNADVCAWAGHLAGNPCPRCGQPNP